MFKSSLVETALAENARTDRSACLCVPSCLMQCLVKVLSSGLEGFRRFDLSFVRENFGGTEPLQIQNRLGNLIQFPRKTWKRQKKVQNVRKLGKRELSIIPYELLQ